MRTTSILAALLAAVAIQAQTVSPRIDALTIDVDPGGPVLHRPGVQIPFDMPEKKVSGKVVVEAQLNEQGEVVDANILSGPLELRRAALQAVLQWHYALTGAQRVRASIDFKLPPELPMQVRSDFPSTVSEATTRRIGRIDLTGLPEALVPLLSKRLAEFEGKVIDGNVMNQIRQAVKSIDSHYVSIFVSDNGGEELTVRMTLSTSPGSSQSMPSGPIRVGGNVQSANQLKRVEPVYPALALQARISGMVRFTILVSPTGNVTRITVVSGHPLLIPAAQEAVKQWTYRPTHLNGQPVEVQTTAEVEFKLP